MRWLAYMPLRGGSKSIPKKNIRDLAGRPLFVWALQEALASGCFEEIHVGTDSDEIRQLCKSWFPDSVKLFDRCAETCTDQATTESAMLEFQRAEPFDVLCLIQATSPFTAAEHFRAAKAQFLADGADSLLTAVRTRRFFWKTDAEPLNYDPQSRPRRQNFEGVFMENGAFYMTRSALLSRRECRLGGKISIFEMPEDTALELDEPQDWLKAEAYARNLRAHRKPTGSRVLALVVDVDGTMTDGGMYYGASGEALKKFNTRDAYGLQRLVQAGVSLFVITAERSPAVDARMNKLGIENYFPGVADKPELLKELSEKHGIPLSQVAYMGDDLGDLECLLSVGVACCPPDAVPAVKANCDFIASHRAGEGAVREVCEFILTHCRA